MIHESEKLVLLTHLANKTWGTEAMKDTYTFLESKFY